MSSTDTEKIIGRLKEALEAKSDGQLANYIGISRQNIGAARKRKDVPAGWIYKVAALTGCSMDWLRFGQGPKIRVAYTAEERHPGGQLASPQSAYDPQIGRQPGPIDEFRTDKEDASFGAAVEMLAKIYSSGDRLLINTINANIRAFCEAIDRKLSEERSTRQLENLKERLANIEKQLEVSRPSVKKENKSKG